jgi:hypothetical protein
MIRSDSRHMPIWPGVLVCAAFAATYALTLQRQINGAGHLQMMDVAEMQIVLASWGTLHPSGYPLYTIAGNLFVAFCKWLGMPAAVASSGFSLLLGVTALALLYRFMWELTGRTLPSITATILLGVSRTFWLFSSVAQTYTMNAVLIVLLIWLSLRYSRQARERDLILIGLVTGLTLVHHRTVVHLLPWLGLLVVLPVIWNTRPWRALLIGGALVILPLGLYLYIPLRTTQGAAYQYMQVKTPSDLWYFVSQKEYQPHFQFVASTAEAVGRMRHALDLWLGDLSAIGLLSGIVGLFAGIFRAPERRLFLALGLAAFSMMIFPLWYVDPDSMFIPLFIILAAGAGVLVNESMIRWRTAPWLAGALLASVAALLAPGNLGFVRSLTYDPASQNLIDAAAAIPTPCPIILSHWGWDLKAYQYGQIVTGQLACARIVTPDDDLRKLLRDGQNLYVAAHFFYQISQDEFRQHVGSTHLNSAGLGMVEISKHIQASPPPDLEGQPTPVGPAMTLLGYRAKRGTTATFDVTLFWQAKEKPASNYSVFVRLTDQDEVTSPGDIIAQVDSQSPVYGWYPTSQWQAGEVVREDYELIVPPDQVTRLSQLGDLRLAVGMYTQDNAGIFHNLGVASFPFHPGD